MNAGRTAMVGGLTGRPAGRPTGRGAAPIVGSVIDRLSIYLPLLLMGVLALGSYWLVRSTPIASTPEVVRPLRHEPDYFMRDFAVRTFDTEGVLRREIFGVEGRHYPDTDTLEIDQPRIRAIGEKGSVVVATGNRALSNADGTEVELFGNAVVTREPFVAPDGKATPRMQFLGEYLHAFTDTERVTSNRPVTLIRGADRFTADAMDYDNLVQVANLRGRVRGLLVPQQQPQKAAQKPQQKPVAPAPAGRPSARP